MYYLVFHAFKEIKEKEINGIILWEIMQHLTNGLCWSDSSLKSESYQNESYVLV